jgi:hypothetical protein
MNWIGIAIVTAVIVGPIAAWLALKLIGDAINHAIGRGLGW